MNDRLTGTVLGAEIEFNYRTGWRGLIDRVRILMAMPVFDRGYVVNVYTNPWRPVPVIQVPEAGSIRVFPGVEEYARSAQVVDGTAIRSNPVTAPTPPSPVHDGSGGESQRGR